MKFQIIHSKKFDSLFLNLYIFYHIFEKYCNLSKNSKFSCVQKKLKFSGYFLPEISEKSGIFSKFSLNTIENPEKK